MITDFRAQSLANTAWAFSSCKFYNEPLLDAISSEARKQMCEFAMQNLSNTVWSFSTLKCSDRPLFDAIAASALPIMTPQPQHPQNLANTAWAFASQQFRHEPLMHAIASQAIHQISEPSESSSLLSVGLPWAFWRSGNEYAAH